MNPSELTQLLYHIEKPGRYVGGEYNQIRKDWNAVKTHFALIFPDIYDLGQPNLGLAILYDLLNRREDVLAERAYAPWVDMEALMRKKGVPLFSLESKTPLASFDILGISIPYESIYTNVLNILDLAGLPVLSRDRNASHPLIVAGGQACYNPEPMSDFIDAFVIGEGEEIILEICDCYQAWKQSGTERGQLLRNLAKIEGLYIPSLYDVCYNSDGTVAAFAPVEEGLPRQIHKRIVAKLPPPPKTLLVPNVEIVHDRISIEIMRGCTRGCRFCHAGFVNRPVRERPVQEIVQSMQDGTKATGYEEIGLLSLSSSDYREILPLVHEIHSNFKDQRLSVSLPSLRIASFSVDLMDQLRDLRPGGGFTLAPEAATERMRNIINKPLDDSLLFETVETIFEHGWLSLKLYYMIGLPNELMEDVEAILNTARKIRDIGRRICGKRINIHIGLGSFIPKTHTPFQWYPLAQQEDIQKKIDFLKEGTRKLGIKLSYNLPDSSLLEAWLSRGDRRLGPVIQTAWQNGAKFDAWGERFKSEIWKSAFAQHEIDPSFYTQRPRPLDEILPWDHISAGVDKDFLLADLALSQAETPRPDCRNSCFGCGILEQFSALRPQDSYWGCP